MPELDRYETERPNLCVSLRWKMKFIEAPKDPTVPLSNSGYFWCTHTQNCLGPDGQVAEPGNCDSTARGCHKLEYPLA